MDGSICASCHQPVEWCVCDDPVTGESLEEIILDAPVVEALDFNDLGIRTDDPSQFEEDFERDLPELEPEEVQNELLSEKDSSELLSQDADYQRWISEGGTYDPDEDL